MAGIVSASLDLYLTTALIILATWAYLAFASAPKPRAQTYISLILLAHTLYILYLIIITPPPNLFEFFNLPVNTPTDAVRAMVLQNSDTGEIPTHWEILMKRLGSFELRTLYVRFGHNVLSTCEYCHTYQDYALYALPRPLLSYVREIAVMGVLTLGVSGRAHLRPLGLGALIIAGLAEAYWLTTSVVRIPPPNVDMPVFMLHDKYLLWRNLFFLFLPLCIQYLPGILPPTIRLPIITAILHPPPTITPEMRGKALHATAKGLEHLIPTLHLLKYTRASLMRLPSMRERAGRWWAEEQTEGEWIRDSEEVQKAARAAGLPFNGTDEPLRVSARTAIEGLMAGLKPSEHWVAQASG